MLLQQGEVQGYNFDRMVVEFTMLNQDKVIPCAISTAAMDELEGRRDVKPEERVAQFMRLREVCAAERSAAAGQYVCRTAVVPEAAMRRWAIPCPDCED